MLPLSNPYNDESAESYFQIHDESVKLGFGARLAAYAESVQGGTGSMLELGCGRGELLRAAQARGWICRGVEMTREYAEIARAAGVRIEVARVEECRAFEDQYDVILTAAVLEHLYDPMLILHRSFDALRPGGLLFIDVPNEGSLAMKVGNLYQRFRRRNWALNLSPTFPPFHVIGFSPDSLRYALRTVGFTVRKLDVVKYANNVPDSGTFLRKVERLGMSVVQKVGERIHMGDGLVCWAQKPIETRT